MKNKIRILYIDALRDRQLIMNVLQKADNAFEIFEAESRPKAEQTLAHNIFDVVLSDINIPGFDGLEVLTALKASIPDTPVIIITANGSEEIAIQAMKLGAADYVIKSEKHIHNLPAAIQNVIKLKNEQDEDKLKFTVFSENEERLHLLLENSLDAILLTEQDGNILKANAAACAIFGKTEAELKMKGRKVIIDITDPRLAPALEERSRKGSV